MSSEIICGSFEDHKNYFISHSYEKKNQLKVKIIKFDHNNIDVIEEKINVVLSEFNGKFEIVDIKYTDESCMIIYKKL
jgi:selenocysteine lyase/cysteine desulfurase